MVSSRLKIQYCKVIIATSLVWLMLDAVMIMYYTDCSGADKCNNVEKTGAGGEPRKPSETGGLLGKLLPRGFLNRAAVGPGDNGKAVVVPDDKKEEAKEKFKINQFNLIASDMMSLNRTLPDYRMDACRKKDYPPFSLMSKVSVIIVFHNEAWSTLLRTVWSVINRSPSDLLQEVILVDDASEREELGRELDMYLASLPVHSYVIRSEQRTGLIRARLKGAEKSKGGILLFLDAHCEATPGWLEPLVAQIYKDRKSVVCPIIDVISDDTFEYITGSDMTWGGFNWKLSFRWYPVPQRELERRGGDRSQPTKTPTMAGGLFAIDRDYFYEIGAYDEGMDIWGGENLEMSFRVWMCGGSVLIMTCSRVGHVFRKTSPYSWPGGVARIINHNTMRTVEVWMDEFKDFFYKINPGMRAVEYGDISPRLKLREKLQCKSFRWYLENVYPESAMPLDYLSLGEIRNKETGMCLDSMGRKSSEKVGMVMCHNMGGNQVFVYSRTMDIRTDDQLCISFARTGLIFLKCDRGNPLQAWQYMPQTLELRHPSSKQCLGKPSATERDSPSIGACDGSQSQQWILENLNMKMR